MLNRKNKQSTASANPIKITLTHKQNMALSLAGDSADHEVEGVIALILQAQGVSPKHASDMAVELATEAIEARRIITQATRYEIVVID